MTLDDVVLEYGRSQLTVIELQKTVRVLAAKNAELTKQLVDKKEARKTGKKATPEVPTAPTS